MRLLAECCAQRAFAGHACLLGQAWSPGVRASGGRLVWRAGRQAGGARAEEASMWERTRPGGVCGEGRVEMRDPRDFCLSGHIELGGEIRDLTGTDRRTDRQTAWPRAGSPASYPRGFCPRFSHAHRHRHHLTLTTRLARSRSGLEARLQLWGMWSKRRKHQARVSPELASASLLQEQGITGLARLLQQSGALAIFENRHLFDG